MKTTRQTIEGQSTPLLYRDSSINSENNINASNSSTELQTANQAVISYSSALCVYTWSLLLHLLISKLAPCPLPWALIGFISIVGLALTLLLDLHYCWVFLLALLFWDYLVAFVQCIDLIYTTLYFLLD